MSFASARMTFSGQMPLSSPKKRVKSKKSFSFQFKEKWRARDMQLISPQASIGCCGLSFSITGLNFSGKMPLSSPKKRVKSKKSFSFELKEKWRARDMQLLSPQVSIGCCRLSFSITELIFSGKMPLGTPKKRVKSKKSRA